MLRSVALVIFLAGSLAAVSSCGSAASAQAPLVIAGVNAAPGTTSSGAITVAPRGGDAGASIPFTIVRGRTAGPVLALVAGTHGAEYVPIIALQRMRTSLNAATLRGTVIMVHVANMPSFLARTVYYSPADNKNLNRVFPGKADGSLSERIAEAITREVIAQATHVIDLHCGDGNESLRPYSYWITTGDPKGRKRGADLLSPLASNTSSSTDPGRRIRRRPSICRIPPSREGSPRSRQRRAAWASLTRNRSDSLTAAWPAYSNISGCETPGRRPLRRRY